MPLVALGIEKYDPGDCETILYCICVVLLVAEPLSAPLTTAVVFPASTITEGRLEPETQSVNIGSLFVKEPVKGVELVSPPEPGTVVHVKL